MKEALKELAYHYFQEIANDGRKAPEILWGYADNFVEDVARLMSARKDFKED